MPAASFGTALAAARVARVVRALPIVIDGRRATVRCGLSNVFLAARRITASLDRYALFRWFNRLTGNRAPSTEPIYSSASLDSCARAGADRPR